MSYSFKIPLKHPPEDVLEHIATTLADHGLKLFQTTDGASITGRGFEGLVRFTFSDMEVEITKKPYIVPWSMVESKLKAFFTE